MAAEWSLDGNFLLICTTPSPLCAEDTTHYAQNSNLASSSDKSFSPKILNSSITNPLTSNTQTSPTNLTFAYVSIQNSPQSSKSPYEYRWLRKTVLLIYCTLLIFAGYTLYIFPVLGTIVAPIKKANPEGNAETSAIFAFYAELISITITIIWLFVFVSMSIAGEDPGLHLNWMGGRFGNLSHSKRAWISSLVWYSIIALVLGGLAGIYYVLGPGFGILS